MLSMYFVKPTVVPITSARVQPRAGFSSFINEIDSFGPFPVSAHKLHVMPVTQTVVIEHMFKRFTRNLDPLFPRFLFSPVFSFFSLFSAAKSVSRVLPDERMEKMRLPYSYEF